jgi:hypothetical protein
MGPGAGEDGAGFAICLTLVTQQSRSIVLYGSRHAKWIPVKGVLWIEIFEGRRSRPEIDPEPSFDRALAMGFELRVTGLMPARFRSASVA